MYVVSFVIIARNSGQGKGGHTWKRKDMGRYRWRDESGNG